MNKQFQSHQKYNMQDSSFQDNRQNNLIRISQASPCQDNHPGILRRYLAKHRGHHTFSNCLQNPSHQTVQVYNLVQQKLTLYYQSLSDPGQILEALAFHHFFRQDICQFPLSR